MKKLFLVFSTICILAPALATAKMSLMKEFKVVYPSAKLPVSCKVCHEATPKLNYYGLDIEKANNSLKAVEALDSDGDGVSNIDEINKGSMPGDKTSVPAATIEAE